MPGERPRDVSSLEARLGSVSDRVDQWTRELFESRAEPPAERFWGILEYHLGWRDQSLAPLPETAPAGKRLRAGIALLVCEAVCGSDEPARDAAVALELLHNFSLVHDDIQDASRLRRHRPTIWSLWGAEQGINAGDALFSLSQLALLRNNPELGARSVRRLNEACIRLVEGQFLDLELQTGRMPPTLDLYEAMVERKTAALFSCSARLGALAGGASAVREEAYAAFGKELGMAFQMQDDLLGVWGKEEETGKPWAADVLERKRGLPAVLGLARSDSPAWLQSFYADTAPTKPVAVRRVADYLEEVGVRQACEQRVQERFVAALAALDRAGGHEPARGELGALFILLTARRA